MSENTLNQIKSAILGLATGDALGVPVEFKSKSALQANPVTDMMGFGTHQQPAGTWSDDSSLTFCLMESLCNGYDLEDLSQKFQAWKYEAYWTPHGKVFDIGISTAEAITRLKEGVNPIVAGGMEESSNGNGSLMRILPLAFHLQTENDIQVRYQKVKEVSSLTHAHFRSVFACFVYIEFTLQLLDGNDAQSAYTNTKKVINAFVKENGFNPLEIKLFNRVLQSDISTFPNEGILGSGYVLHSLEASLWCLLTSTSYAETVLKAVNLGQDTDTTGAIAGGLAGLLYGENSIPIDWLDKLAKKSEIVSLCERFYPSAVK